MNPANENPAQTLTTTELARALKVHPVTIRADRAAGNTLGIPFVRVGRSVRYLVADVTAWLEQHRTA